MLGLLISQPSSSQHNHPPPPPSITHHHNRNDDDGGDDGDDDGSDGDGSLKVCKDCGNRAKKECSFRRCRTCCKTRGFDCATHERSTWIPASKRRDKKIGSGSGSCSSYGGVKRPRTFVPSPSSHINVTNSSSSANDFSLGISSYTQDSRFKKCLPRRIEARAVFRNIRVIDVSDGEAENAYVATVNISGHVFRGLLYDHGTGTHRGIGTHLVIDMNRFIHFRPTLGSEIGSRVENGSTAGHGFSSQSVAEYASTVCPRRSPVSSRPSPSCLRSSSQPPITLSPTLAASSDIGTNCRRSR
ncbi:hypothetical protein LWI28_002320 [Acer negundo]|uniref:Uncharacterized protein n=1 Tax=Acer negundo TaxID=4023 RepID=A0AAD5I8C6_ACENE|nr:hypothetical protein LWI28_002320 [Acer negundo]